MKSTKPSSEAGQGGGPGKSETARTQEKVEADVSPPEDPDGLLTPKRIEDKPTEKKAGDLISPRRPEDLPAPAPEPDKSEPVDPPDIDPVYRDVVKNAALLFARNITNVKGMKYCYSRYFGDWRLYVYKVAGDKATMHVFVWDKDSEQFHADGNVVTIKLDELEFRLKHKLNDESCYILKSPESEDTSSKPKPAGPRRGSKPR
jgi:hypothetical protein